MSTDLRPAAEPATPFMALERHHEPLRDELHEAFERVVGASAFILGEEVEQFEAEYAAYCGSADCVGVASGTAALTLALLAAGIGPGDEVIVPAHTYIATALAVVHTGAEPVFCDVEEDTGLIDPVSAAAALTSSTVAVIPVHLYGQTCDMAAVTELARRHGLFVLEDAAQAHGAVCEGRRTGSLGDAAAFSFYPSKNLGALGDGGAVCTDDAALAERMRRLRHLGQRRKGEHVDVGFNLRLDGLQAALLRVKLPHLEHWNRRRRHLAACYRTALAGTVEMLPERPEHECVYHLFPVRHHERNLIADELARSGIATALHYTPAVHHQPPFIGGSGTRCELDRAERWAREELSLPMYPELPADEVARIGSACAAAARQADAASRVIGTEANSGARSTW